MKHRPLALALIFFISACSTGDDSASKVVSDQRSPFEVFFEDDGGHEAALRAWQIEVQEDIATCMKEEGFDFVPSLPASTSASSQDKDLTRKEWAEKYGYGISTLSESYLTDLSADPNTGYVLSLSETDQAVYSEKLIGKTLANADPDSPPMEIPLAEQGCTGSAVLDHGGTAITEDLTEALTDYDQQMSEVMLLDEVSAAVGEWSSCMAENGYEYPNQETIMVELRSEFAAIIEPLNEGLSSLSKGELDSIAISPESANEFLPNFEWSVLAGFQEREKSISGADLKCFETRLEPVLLPHRHKVEEGILVEYGEEMLAAQEFLAEES